MNITINFKYFKGMRYTKVKLKVRLEMGLQKVFSINKVGKKHFEIHCINQDVMTPFSEFELIREMKGLSDVSMCAWAKANTDFNNLYIINF